MNNLNLVFFRFISKLPSNYLERIKSGPGFEHFLNLKRKKGVHLNIPPWLRTDIPSGKSVSELHDKLSKLKLHTVCQEARCPNMNECWKSGTATIMILGDECTRGCRFCSVKTNRAPPFPDVDEPDNTAEAIVNMGLSYVVITSVDRDDLPDQGSIHYANTVRAIKRKSEGKIIVECLTPDFCAVPECIERVALSGVDVFAHNIETVKNLQKLVRDPRAGYEQSLNVLTLAKKFNPSLITKTSLMLGFGETDDEIMQTIRDARNAGIDCITFGQYMQPTKRHIKVHEYITPEKFNYWHDVSLKLGFKYAASGPLVRSSYKAGEYFMESLLKQKRLRNE